MDDWFFSDRKCFKSYFLLFFTSNINFFLSLPPPLANIQQMWLGMFTMITGSCRTGVGKHLTLRNSIKQLSVVLHSGRRRSLMFESLFCETLCCLALWERFILLRVDLFASWCNLQETVERKSLKSSQNPIKKLDCCWFYSLDAFFDFPFRIRKKTFFWSCIWFETFFPPHKKFCSRHLFCVFANKIRS